MPITSSAKKALKQDRSRAVRNTRQRVTLKRALKNVTKDNLSETVSLVDKAAKNNLIHPNKAGRIKAGLAKQLGIATKKRATAGTTAPKKKTTTKKTAKKE